MDINLPHGQAQLGADRRKPNAGKVYCLDGCGNFVRMGVFCRPGERCPHCGSPLLDRIGPEKRGSGNDHRRPEVREKISQIATDESNR